MEQVMSDGQGGSQRGLCVSGRQLRTSQQQARMVAAGQVSAWVCLAALPDAHGLLQRRCWQLVGEVASCVACTGGRVIASGSSSARRVHSGD